MASVDYTEKNGNLKMLTSKWTSKKYNLINITE